MQKVKAICQSCALPLTNENSGTNIDASINHEYCKFCYLNGNFTVSGLTLEKQIEKLTEMAVKRLGSSKVDALQMAVTLPPNLKRWQ